MPAGHTPPRDTHFAYETIGVHLLLEQHRRVSDVVRRNQPVGVIHAGRMYRVPVDHAQRHTVLVLKLQLHDSLVDVMFVSIYYHKQRAIRFENEREHVYHGQYYIIQSQ